MNVKLNLLLANLVFFFCLFPYVTIIKTGSDVQPYALIFAILFLIYLFLKNKYIKSFNPSFLLLLPIVYSVIMLSNSFSFLLWLRSFYGYLTIPILSLVAYNSFSLLSGKILNFSIKIWFLFAIVQKFIYKFFGNILVARISTSTDRWVTSLAVEPSAFANICLFLFLLNDLFYYSDKINKKSYNFNIFLLLLQFIMANSAMGYLLLIVYFFTKIFIKSGIKSRIFQVICIFLSIYLFQLLRSNLYLLPINRVTSILLKLNEDWKEIFFTDQSISDRLAHILISGKSLFTNYGLGYGLGTWSKEAYGIIDNSGTFIQKLVSTNFTSGRIMSGWGTIFFEIGIIGLLIVVWYISIFVRGNMLLNKKGKSIMLIAFVSITFTMSLSVTIAFPLFSYILGLYAYVINNLNDNSD
ncbi:hypothetical protein HQ672_01275 [Enterococcus faecium]|nr:hypothetical protein [Enterococcus faecium]